MEMLLPGGCFLGFGMALYFLLAVGQTMHAVVLRRNSEADRSGLRLAYEWGLVVHLLISEALFTSLAHGWFPLYVPFGLTLMAPVEAFMWFNGALLVMGIVCAVRHFGFSLLAELPAIAVLLPSALQLLQTQQDAFVMCLIINMAALTFCVLWRLMGDWESGYKDVSALAMESTIKMMPEGVLYASKKGRVLLVNDSMRRFLSELGVAADLASLESIQEAIGRGGWQQRWHVISDEARIGRRECVRMVAVNVEEERALEAQIEQANAQLQETESQLAATLEGAREAAADDALIHMRSRLHDVIGQRLSLLHRYLEDEDVDAERLEQMKPLLKGIVSDLQEDADADWRVELQSVVSAFALVGVDVRVSGPEPESLAVGMACMGIIREAATNAVRHASATCVDAVFREEGGAMVLTVSDNGIVDAAAADRVSLREGQGISGMRSAVSQNGGTLEIIRHPSFTVQARFPKMG